MCMCMLVSNFCSPKKDVKLSKSRESFDQDGDIKDRGSIHIRDSHLFKMIQALQISMVCHHQKGGECEVKTLHLFGFDEDKVLIK